MRDIMLLGAMLFLIPMSLRNAFAAYLMWGWTAFVALNFYAYGFMRVIPYNMIFAIIAIATIFISKDVEKKPFLATRTTNLFILFAVQGAITALFAYPDLVMNWHIYIDLLKTMIFCLLMPMVVTKRYRLHALIIALVLGGALHGVLDGLKTIASAGAHRIDGGRFGDNNHLAVVLVMVLPLLLYLFQSFSNLFARVVVVSSIGVLVAAVIGTHSRGGLLALLGVAVWIALTSRRKLLAVVLLGVAFGGALAFAPDSWWARMDTIQSANADSSFMGRVLAWKISSAIALGNPLTGGGFYAIENLHVWTMFKDSPGLLGFIQTGEPDIKGHSAHSIYFEVLGDMGFLGFALFMMILANVGATWLEIKRVVKISGYRLMWARDVSDALAGSLFAYALGGAALSIAYYELPYILIMMLEVTRQIVLREQNTANNEPTPIPVRPQHALPGAR